MNSDDPMVARHAHRVPPPMPLLEFRFPPETITSQRDMTIPDGTTAPKRALSTGNTYQLPTRSTSHDVLAPSELATESTASIGGFDHAVLATSTAGDRPEVMRQCADSGRFSAVSLLSLPMNRYPAKQDESLFFETDFAVAEKVMNTF